MRYLSCVSLCVRVCGAKVGERAYPELEVSWELRTLVFGWEGGKEGGGREEGGVDQQRSGRPTAAARARAASHES